MTDRERKIIIRDQNLIDEEPWLPCLVRTKEKYTLKVMITRNEVAITGPETQLQIISMEIGMKGSGIDTASF